MLNIIWLGMILISIIVGIIEGRIDAVVHAVTDSEYVKNGITKWLASWEKRGWRAAGGKPIHASG